MRVPNVLPQRDTDCVDLEKITSSEFDKIMFDRTKKMKSLKVLL